MTMIERVAWRLWRADSEDAGVPASVTNGRTQEAFAEQSEDTRRRWLKFARAAIEAMREPTDAMIDAGAMPDCNDPHGRPSTVWGSMIDAALNEQVSG